MRATIITLILFIFTLQVFGQTYIRNPFVSGTTAVQRINFSAVATSGTYTVAWDTGVATGLAWNATSSTIQTKIRTLPQLSGASVSGTAATAIDVTFNGYDGAPSLLSILNSTLVSGSTQVSASATTTTVGVKTKVPTTSTWVELSPSLSYGTNWINVDSNTSANLLLGTGAAGSEVGKVLIFPNHQGRYNINLNAGDRLVLTSVSGTPTVGSGALEINLEKN